MSSLFRCLLTVTSMRQSLHLTHYSHLGMSRDCLPHPVTPLSHPRHTRVTPRHVISTAHPSLLLRHLRECHSKNLFQPAHLPAWMANHYAVPKFQHFPVRTPPTVLVSWPGQLAPLPTLVGPLTIFPYSPRGTE